MNKKKAEKIYKEKGIVYMPKYKKFWYSITKFEKYPEMATEGVGRAFSYLVWLMFIFSILVVIGLLFKFHGVVKEGIKYLDANFSEINYKDGNLSVVSNNNTFISEIGNVTISTNEISQEEILQYKNLSNTDKLEIVWLKDKVIFKVRSTTGELTYKDVLGNFGIEEFNKESLINYLSNEIKSPRLYVTYGVIMLAYSFLGYFLAILLDILILSLFGLLTTVIARIEIRYRAIFNMSVYAITLSTFLQLINVFIKLFTDFNIKYFDLMYTAISFICLAAAIFIIKSDVIKKQLQLMQIIEMKKKQEEQEKQDEEEKEEREEDNTEEGSDSEEKKNDDEVDSNVEGQGSNA